MEMIEKYLYAIGKKLPIKQKNDIIEELRSLIMDNLDDKTKGKEPTENDINEVLLKMGSPTEVAKRYRTGPSWLIGPELFDIYQMIIKIVLGAVLLGYLISIIVSLITALSGGNFGEMIFNISKSFLDIIPGLFSAIGIVTVIFAIIERTAKKPLDIDFGEDIKWTPAKLESIPTKDETVKPIESILAMAFTILLLIVFNFYREKLGLYYVPSLSDSWVMVKIFNLNALNTYIPLWSVVWVLSIGLYGWILSIGKRNTGTRIFEMCIAAMNIGILFFMAKGPNLFEFDKVGNDFVDLQPMVDFFTNNQSTIFYVLATLAILGLVVNLISLIVKRVKEMKV